MLMKPNIPFPRYRKSRNTIFRFSHSNKPNFRKLISQCKDNGKCPVAEVIDYGGPGSGDFGHRGRPGQVGGSAGGGGGSSGGPEFDPSGSPDSPDFVGPPDPSRVSGGGSARSAGGAAPRGASGEGDDFTPDELGITPEVLGPDTGAPGTPSFVGPPAPGSIDASRTTSEILSSIGETLAKGNAQSEALAKDLQSIDGSDTETVREVEAAIQDFPDLPPNIFDTLTAILDAGIASAPAFAGAVKDFLSDIFTSDGDAVDIDTAEAGIDKFNNSVLGVSRDEILSSVRKDFRRLATNDILQTVADEVFKGNVKPDKESVRKAIEAIQAANRESGPGSVDGDTATKRFSNLRKGVKESLSKTVPHLITGKIERFLAFQIMNGDLGSDDASVQKAFDDLISAREGLAADKAQAKEDEKLAKAEAKAANRTEKDRIKAEKAEQKRINTKFPRRFIRSSSGSIPSDPKEPTDPPPTIPDIISDLDDLDTDDVAAEDIVLSLTQSLGSSDAIENDVKALEDAGIVSTSGDGIVSITNNGSIAPVKIDVQKISACGQRSKLERSGKDSDLQQIVDNGIDRGSINADSNISEVLSGLQDTCPLDNKTDFVRFLLKKSDNPEADTEILVDDGIADRDESGNVFIVEDSGAINKNSEKDVYMLAESCLITANNGCPLLLSAFAERDNKDIGWTEVFEFDDSNVLDILVKNFSKLREQLSPPLKLGHDESQKLVQNSGFPSAGWITGLKRKGSTNKLLAFFSSVPGPIVKLIESGAYKRISAEIYNNYIDPDTSEEFGPAMRAVSILGADVPRIKTLKDLAVIYHSDGLPYKTFQTEDSVMLDGEGGNVDDFGEHGNMDQIMAMLDKLREEIVALAGLGRDKVEGAVNEIDGAVEALQEKFGKTANHFTALCERQKKEIKKLKKIDKSAANADTLKLSETIDSQASLITQLSESVKTIGTELKSATDHMLETKKKSVHATLSKNFSPALVEKAMPLINFSEGDDKIVDLLKTMQQLQEESALFLEEPVNIEQQEFTNSMLGHNSEDKLHNEITALSEKDGIGYTEAFDRVLALKSATK